MLRNKVTQLITFAKREYFNGLINENADDPSKIWFTIRKLIPKRNKNSLREIVHDGLHLSDSSSVANCFNKFFTSVGSRLRNALHPRNSNSLNRPSNLVSDFVFQEISDFVRKELSALRVKKSSGLKDIHSRSLKIASNTLASPLTYIFNLSLETGQIIEIIGLITSIYSTSIKVPISCLGILHICNLWILLRKIVIYFVGRKFYNRGFFCC